MIVCVAGRAAESAPPQPRAPTSSSSVSACACTSQARRRSVHVHLCPALWMCLDRLQTLKRTKQELTTRLLCCMHGAPTPYTRVRTSRRSAVAAATRAWVVLVVSCAGDAVETRAAFVSRVLETRWRRARRACLLCWRRGGDACGVGVSKCHPSWRRGGDACGVGVSKCHPSWRRGGDACGVSVGERHPSWRRGGDACGVSVTRAGDAVETEKRHMSARWRQWETPCGCAWRSGRRRASPCMETRGDARADMRLRAWRQSASPTRRRLETPRR
jgi:hypothetical protein